MRVGVASEVGTLEAVVVGPPGDEFDRMVPANLEAYRTATDGSREPNPDYLMFDDLILLGRMQSEHRQLVEVLKAATGPHGVHTVRGMLAASLGDAKVRAEAVAEVVALEQELYHLSDRDAATLERKLLPLNATRLTDTLFTGVERYSHEPLLRWPIPNALFARDLGAVMGSAMVLTYAARAGRRRDMLLARFVARHHPLFEGIDIVDVAEDGPVRQPDGTPVATLEGGDLQVLSDTVALVGCGIRTTVEASRRLAAKLLARGFQAVVRVELPMRRGAMHLDTVFTQIAANECLVFPPMVQAPQTQDVAITVMTAAGEQPAGDDLLGALAGLGIPLEPVWCGGDDPIAQQREQWSDGANAFALAPGVIVTYARNVQTLRQLGLHGYKTVTCEEFVRNAAFYLNAGNSIAVAIEGTELVRGRGGPRCLTMPLRRS